MHRQKPTGDFSFGWAQGRRQPTLRCLQFAANGPKPTMRHLRRAARRPEEAPATSGAQPHPALKKQKGYTQPLFREVATNPLTQIFLFGLPQAKELVQLHVARRSNSRGWTAELALAQREVSPLRQEDMGTACGRVHQS